MRAGPRRTPVEGSFADDAGDEPPLAARFDAGEDREMALSLPPVEENVSPYKWLMAEPEAAQPPVFRGEDTAAAEAREHKEDEPMADYGDAPLPSQRE